MSDVSGIPNMGFGGGNFFAPTFSYNPQLSAGAASAAYAPEAAYAQNVTNNLFSSGGGFGRQTDYYSQLAANQLSALTPYTFNETNAGTGMTVPQMYQTFQGGGPGGGTSLNTQAWDQSSAGPDWGPGTGFSTGGGGLFSGNANSLGGGGGGYTGSPIDWSGVGNAAAGMSAPSSAQPFDWSHIFGGAKADPAPGMAMPGGLNSPMTFPQQEQPQPAKAQEQPAFDFSGGNAGWGNAPSPTMPDTQKLLGYDPSMTPAAAPAAGPDKGVDPNYWGDVLGSKSDQPAPEGTRTYDFKPMFEGGGGFGSGGTDSQTFGAPAAGSLGGSPFGYFTDPGATKEASGPSADDLAAQGRAKLAALMGGERPIELAADPTASAAKEPGAAAVPLPAERPAEAPPREEAENPLYPATEDVAFPNGVPLPRERPEGADAPRPSADVKFTVEPGKEAGIRGVQPRLSAAIQGGAALLPPGYSVEAYSGERSGADQAYHRGGRAMDVRIIGPDGPIPSEGADSTGMYQLLARGVKTWATQNDPQLVGQMGWGGAFGTQRAASGGANSVADLMHFDLGGSRGALVPNVQFGRLTPLSAEEQNAMPANIPLLGTNQVALDARGAGPIGLSAAPLEQGQGVNAGQEISRPPADIPAEPTEAVPLPTARPAAANIAQANSVLDSRILDLVQKNSPSNVDRIPSSIANQTLREALGNSMTGGMIRSGLTPYLPQMGVTQAEFDKAYAGGRSAVPAPRFFGDDQSITNQPLAPGELNDNWNKFIYEATDRPTMARNESLGADPNPFTNFTQSPNVEDRRFAPELTDAERQANPYTGGKWTFDPQASIPEGGSMGEALGTRQIDNLEANVTAQRMAGQGVSAAPRAFDDGTEAATFNERVSPFDDTTGMRDFVSPEQDYSAFQQPASRDALAKTMTFGGGFSSSPEPRQGGVGPQAELTPDFMDVIKEVESGGDPNQVTGSYKGLYQLDDKEFRKYGGTGSIFDPEENTKAASAKMVDENQRVQDILGRALTPSEQYMVHQQGVAGSLAHLANPDELAWKNYQGAASSSEAVAKAAIWKNMTPEMQNQFGNDVNNVTSRDFLRLWDDRYYGILNR